MMNILLLVPEFPPKTLWGLANYSYNIAKYLKKENNVKVAIVPLDKAPKAHFSNLHFVCAMMKKVSELKKMDELDIVYTITIGPRFSIVGLYTKIAHIPFVCHGVGSDLYSFNPLNLLSRKLAYSISKQLICGSLAQKETMIKEGAPTEKIKVVLGGVDTTIFKPSLNTRKEMRQFLGVEDKFVLLSLGRVVSRKGFDIAIRSLTFLNDIHDIVLLIAGDGPERLSLSKIVKDLDLTNRVRFLGLLPSNLIVKLYNAADLLVAPFREIGRDKEGFPLVVQEAQACGIPVVTTDTAGVPELIEDGKTGFIVQMDSPKKIAEKVRQLYEDRKLYASLAEEGRKRAEQLLDWKIAVGGIERILKEACP